MKNVLPGLALLLAASAVVAPQEPATIESRLEILTVATGEREIVH